MPARPIRARSASDGCFGAPSASDGSIRAGSASDRCFGAPSASEGSITQPTPHRAADPSLALGAPVYPSLALGALFNPSLALRAPFDSWLALVHPQTFSTKGDTP